MLVFARQPYMDPVALASLIVGVASLAWTVYTDLRKRTVKPTAEINMTVQVTHPDTPTARANLTVSRRAGRAADALIILEQVTSDRALILGSDHHEILTARADPASVYWRAGRCRGRRPRQEGRC